MPRVRVVRNSREAEAEELERGGVSLEAGGTEGTPWAWGGGDRLVGGGGGA